MKVSIIIPVYNVEKYILACINSILIQDYDNIEIIIVDDCSPDNSISIVKEIVCISETPIKIITHNKNKGLSAARNSGIKASTGDAIYFIDSDDELSGKSVISELVQELEKTDADIAIGNYQRVYRNTYAPSKRYSQKKVIIGNENIIKALYLGDIPIIACNKLIRKDFLLKNQLYFKEGFIHEDELWTFLSVIASNAIVLTGKITYNYLQNENSIMGRTGATRLQASIDIYCELVKTYNQHCKTCNKNLDAYLNRFAFQRYKEIMSLDENLDLKKRLYKKLREYQLGTKLSKTLLTHLHLLLPETLGFHLMHIQMALYSYYLRLKNK